MTVDLGHILLATGRLRPKQLQEAVAKAAETGRDLEETLLAGDLLTEEELAQTLSRHFEIPGLALGQLPRPNARVTKLVPEAVARERRIVPLERAGDTLILLMQDPTDIETINLVRTKASVEIQPVVASGATLREALETFYPSTERRLLASVLPFVGKLITEEAARAYRALPVDRDGKTLTVAMAGANTAKVSKAIELATGLQVKAIAAPWEDIEAAIVRIHRAPAPPAAQPDSGAAAAKSATAPAPANGSAPMAAAPSASLDDFLGDGALRPAAAAGPLKPAAPPPPAGGLGLGLDLAIPTAARAAAPAGGGGGSLSLDLGLGGTPTNSPPLGAPPAGGPPPAAAKQGHSGNGNGKGHAAGLSLDGLLGSDTPSVAASGAAPAARPGDGGLKLSDLQAEVAGGDIATGPFLGAAGSSADAPRTGLKVDTSTREEMRALVSKTWGELDLRLGKLLPEKLARNYRMVVTGRLAKKLFIAMENPNDTFAIETARFATHLQVEVTAATPEAIEAGLTLLYVPDDDPMAAVLAGLAGVGLDDVELREDMEEMTDLDATNASEAAPVVRLVNMIIDNALKARASDIHFEIFEDAMRIRLRIDGVLREVMRPPLELRDPLTSRIKIMGKMDISERRLPQDGRLRLRKGSLNKDIDFRISSIPTIFGEKLVMRILDRAQVRTNLVELGLEEEPLEWLREAIHRPYGMCLVVGPSGCGKTNTLYSALADVNTSDVNIMTCEDPVEFSTMGLNQVQARESIGLSFASALRSFLRQDPNIILVGEIRDFETAEIAVKAALTGHMVLSTLHTNDAPACLNRLTNMGVEPFLIGTSLHLIVAQRLVRRVCPSCRMRDDRIRLEQLVQMGFTPEEAKEVEPVRGAGCAKCEGMGFLGRTGLFEVMRITSEMREMILYNGSQMEIKELALRQGMRTLRHAGLTKIKAGITSCEEIIRETIG